MTSLHEHKLALRSAALARRDALDPVYRVEASLRIAEFCREIPVSADDVVAGYWPMRSEVDVRPLMFGLRERHARLCLPVVVDATTIVFRELLRGVPLVETAGGTVGPTAEAAVLEPTIILVPLAAFDRRGQRIGYGAGHYDRAIARLRARGGAPRLVAIAFDCQKVETVLDDPHDVVIPDILTETGLHTMGPAR
ncbi:5-formyltetrahydrofolate cyclo-ligase [Nitratireductor alexandrii]|uniref:5-formyltetrahydrofolate cyclo-ligase n=1 Tax=Nitratireductor alexandrii TaxID=2448161 RepID=UPI000FDAFACA|nr:5-formyltetrahydrofolate cyclo-ligase [Nitratireductor alexandrii]